MTIRAAYSRHVLRAHLGGFKPLTLAQFTIPINRS